MIALALALLVQEVPPAISPDEYSARRAALHRQLGGVVVVPSGQLREGMDAIDANAPFLDFDYLVGARDPGAILVLAPDGTSPQEILFTDTDYEVAPGGIDTVRTAGEFRAFVTEALAEGDPVHLWTLRMVPRGIREIRQALEERGVALATDARAAVTALRRRKSPAELAFIRHASDATNAAHRDVMARIHPGMNEGEIQRIIEERFRSGGCERNAFPCIVGSGPNSCDLHYHRNNRATEEGDLVVIDIGAECRGYATDITRTLPVGGRFTDRQREIYGIVLEAQRRAEAALRPGISLTELDGIARAYIQERGYGRYFIHYLGHFVGMSVHDTGEFGDALGPGDVITIEPGIYIPRESLGVRIEDTYVVTAEGFERLSAGAPREIDEVEAALAAPR